MTIGIPRALLYHRYGVLWETFLQELGIPYIVSDETNQSHIALGNAHTVDENCLPFKLFFGHAASLIGRVDVLFVPRFVRLGRRDEFCVRFWGLPDIVATTFPDTPVLTYDVNGTSARCHRAALVRLGGDLGRGHRACIAAYRVAESRQLEADFLLFSQARAALRVPGPNVLLVAQPYIARDRMLGGRIAAMLSNCGGTPVWTDGWNRTDCGRHAHAISRDVYWGINRELLGAVTLAGHDVDGVVLLTAFPCGSDCLTNELVLRRVRHVPVAQLLLDEHQSTEGLHTRIESFLDMLIERRCAL